LPIGAVSLYSIYVSDRSMEEEELSLLMVTSRGPGTERNVRDGNGISPQQLEPRASGRAPVSTDATGQLQQSVSASAQVAVSACHRTLEFTWPAPGGVEGSPAAAGGRRQAAGGRHGSSLLLDCIGFLHVMPDATLSLLLSFHQSGTSE
jgi:hypothetical protein